MNNLQQHSSKWIEKVIFSPSLNQYLKKLFAVEYMTLEYIQGKLAMTSTVKTSMCHALFLNDPDNSLINYL